MANPYESYTLHVRQIAAEWQIDAPELSGKPGTPDIFEAASQEFNDRTLAVCGGHATPGANEAKGASVMFRFLRNASEAAGREGLDFVKLACAAMNPLSYTDALGVAAGVQINVAAPLEEAMGVHTRYSHTSPDMLPYVVGETITIPSLALREKEIKFDVQQSDEPIDPLRLCPAHRYLGDVYMAVVQVALHDMRLMPATHIAAFGAYARKDKAPLL